MKQSRYTTKQAVKRSIALTIGLSIMSLGIAISKLAELGTTPISCIPATLSYTSLTIGVWTIIFNTLLVILQIVLLKKEFKLFQLLQIIVGVLIGTFTDMWMWAIGPHISPDTYLGQWSLCIIAALILGFGVMLEIRSNILMAPGEGLILALSRITGIPFPRMKVISDVSMVAVGALLSVILNGGLYGVREGTVFAAVAVGFIVGFYRNRFGAFIDRILE